MEERVLIHGYEAVGRGALNAGCLHFFGYPITPQNEITEFFASELPERGGRFIQAESESAVGAMLFGAATAGVRTMTSTASPGWGLMQEMLSHISFCELPVVVVNCQRGGPGQGTTRHAQTDYLSATRGGGQGGYKSIVLAPASVQECHDLTQLAFYLADKYNILTIVLCDGILIQIAEPVELRTIDFGPVPEKDWALVGKGKKEGRTDRIFGAASYPPRTAGMSVPAYHEHQRAKYQKIMDAEVRYDTYQAEDAELLLVSYGSSARICRGAVELGRAQGLKLGLFRPITAWPFPRKELREAALRAGRVLVVEDSIGEFVDDVEFAVLGQVPVHLLGVWGRHQAGGSGVIHPERVLEEARGLL